jgi:hypothetical protein
MMDKVVVKRLHCAYPMANAGSTKKKMLTDIAILYKSRLDKSGAKTKFVLREQLLNV